MREPGWVTQIFEAKIVKQRGVVRRKMSSIQRYASLDAVREAAKARGFHIIQRGEHWIIFCDPEVKLIV